MNISIQQSPNGKSAGLRDELRLRVLRALDANPRLNQRQLASVHGVSLGGINYAIKALVERGLVKVGNFQKSGNKGAYVYGLTPQGIADKTSLATAFLGRKLQEYEVLGKELEILKDGVGSDDWGEGVGL